MLGRIRGDESAIHPEEDVLAHRLLVAADAGSVWSYVAPQMAMRVSAGVAPGKTDMALAWVARPPDVWKEVLPKKYFCHWIPAGPDAYRITTWRDVASERSPVDGVFEKGRD